MVGDKVRNHPNRKMIDRFFINGRTPEYVAMWLKNKYPHTQPENIKYQISVVTLEKYQNVFLFEIRWKKQEEYNKVEFRNSRLAEIE